MDKDQIRLAEDQSQGLDNARFLRIGGHLIYSDFVLPSPLAKLGEALAGKLLAFPTRNEIEVPLKAQVFATVHLASGFAHFEGIFQKYS